MTDLNEQLSARRISTMSGLDAPDAAEVLQRAWVNCTAVSTTGIVCGTGGFGMQATAVATITWQGL
jgi:hypothetical protein